MARKRTTNGTSAGQFWAGFSSSRGDYIPPMATEQPAAPATQPAPYEPTERPNPYELAARMRKVNALVDAMDLMFGARTTADQAEHITEEQWEKLLKLANCDGTKRPSDETMAALAERLVKRDEMYARWAK